MKTEFQNIYHRGDWINSLGGTESGPGSSLECSKEYLTFLTQFVCDNNITSILDIGCGDFNLMRHFDFSTVNYLGIDLVDFVIENNQIKYQTELVKFECIDVLNDAIDITLYELILIKDVFQHLNNDTISKLLCRIKESKRILITNDYTTENGDGTIGGYRPVNLSIDPFNVKGTCVFQWDSCGFFKQSFLITN